MGPADTVARAADDALRGTGSLLRLCNIQICGQQLLTELTTYRGHSEFMSSRPSEQDPQKTRKLVASINLLMPDLGLFMSSIYQTDQCPQPIVRTGPFGFGDRLNPVASLRHEVPAAERRRASGIHFSHPAAVGGAMPDCARGCGCCGFATYKLYSKPMG